MTKTPVRGGIHDVRWQDVPRLRSPPNGGAHGLPTGHLPQSFCEASGLPPGTPTLHKPDRIGPQTPALGQAASHWRLLTGAVMSVRCPPPSLAASRRAHVACSCITSLHGPRAGSTLSPSDWGDWSHHVQCCGSHRDMDTSNTGPHAPHRGLPGALGTEMSQTCPVGAWVTPPRLRSHQREQTRPQEPARALQGVDNESHPPQPPLGCQLLSQTALGRMSIQE